MLVRRAVGLSSRSLARPNLWTVNLPHTCFTSFYVSFLPVIVLFPSVCHVFVLSCAGHIRKYRYLYNDMRIFSREIDPLISCNRAYRVPYSSVEFT